MKSLSALVRLLSLFALLGMLVAPVGSIAGGFAMANMSAATDAGRGDMADMQGDMSCCPDERPAKPDCNRSCPFAIICSTSAPLALLRTGWTSTLLTWTSLRYADQRFDRLTSLAAEPPARPPKA